MGILVVFGIIVAAVFGGGKLLSMRRAGPVEAEAARLLGTSGGLSGKYRHVATSVAISSRIDESKNIITVTMAMPALPVRWRVRARVSSHEKRYGEPQYRDELMAPAEVMTPVFGGTGVALVARGVHRLEVRSGSFVVKVGARHGVEHALRLAAEERARVLERFAELEAALPMRRATTPFREELTDAARDEARQRWRAEVDAL